MKALRCVEHGRPPHSPWDDPVPTLRDKLSVGTGSLRDKLSVGTGSLRDKLSVCVRAIKINRKVKRTQVKYRVQGMVKYRVQGMLQNASCELSKIRLKWHS
jgi:hypothetical protein